MVRSRDRRPFVAAIPLADAKCEVMLVLVEGDYSQPARQSQVRDSGRRSNQTGTTAREATTVLQSKKKTTIELRRRMRDVLDRIGVE